MEKGNGTGINLFHILTVVFIGLKLGGAINWGWWLVVLPTLVVFGIYALVFIISVIALVVSGVIISLKDNDIL